MNAYHKPVRSTFWTPVFAWLPVKLDSGKWVWFDYVYRRWCLEGSVKLPHGATIATKAGWVYSEWEG